MRRAAQRFGVGRGHVREALKRLVQTREDVLTPACTGTGAMEAAVSNTLSAGDRVIVVNAGAFAQRWLAICKAYGLTVIELAAPHGETVAPDRIAQALRRAVVGPYQVQAALAAKEPDRQIRL